MVIWRHGGARFQLLTSNLLDVEKLPGRAAVQLRFKETTSEFASKEQNYLTFNVNDV